MTPHRGPSRQRHRRDGPVAAAAGPVGGIPATPCGPRRASAGRASPVTDSLRPTAPAWWPPAHVIRSLPARAPAHGAARAAWSRSCPPGLPATSPAPRLGAIRRQVRVWSGQAPPPPSRRRPPGRPASRAPRRPPLRSRRTAPSCDASVPAPRGTRDAGSRATGRPRLWLPPLPDGAAAPPRPRGRAGAAIAEGRWGWDHRRHHWHGQWLSHQSK